MCPNSALFSYHVAYPTHSPQGRLEKANMLLIVLLRYLPSYMPYFCPVFIPCGHRWTRGLLRPLRGDVAAWHQSWAA